MIYKTIEQQMLSVFCMAESIFQGKIPFSKNKDSRKVLLTPAMKSDLE